MFVCLFFCFNQGGAPTECFPENVMKGGLDLAEILSISKLDWHEGGGEEKKKKKKKKVLVFKSDVCDVDIGDSQVSMAFSMIPISMHCHDDDDR